MKRSSSFSVLRWLLIVLLVIGILLMFVSFLPFETAAEWLNGLAADGIYESFTLERHQTFSRASGWIGVLLAALSGWMLARWQKMQVGLEELSSQLREFNAALRADAREYFRTSSWMDVTKTERLLLLGLMLVAVIMRLASLNIPLIHDEAYTYNVFASGSLWRTVSDYHLPNNHVLLTILINLLTHLFGNHLWLIRLPTVIAGVLMVPAGYVLGRRWYSRETGILGAGLIAVFPALIHYSVLARGYAFLTLFTLLILTLSDRVRLEKNRFAWALLVIVNALGFFTIPIMLYPFGAVYVWLFLSALFGDIPGYRSKFDFLKYWLGSGFASAFLTVLLYSPILVSNSDLFFSNRFVTPVDGELFKTVFWSKVGLTWGEWMGTIPAWFILIGVIGFILGLLLHFKIAGHKVPVQAAFLIWIAAFVIARRPDMFSRMWLFLAAPLLIWSAAGIVESLKMLSNALPGKAPLAQSFVGISVIAIALLGVLTIPTIPPRWAQKSSIESASLFLRDNLRAGDMVTANTAYFPQLRYYFDAYDVPQDYLRRAGPFERAFIVIGERGKETLETVVPVDGANRPVVDMETVRIVLEFSDLIVYEADPAP